MLQLSAVEARVLGALMEKEVTTPDSYPLSLNALVAACNQKSSREPVMQLSERDVEVALRSLDAMELVRPDSGTRSGSRVERYENRARTVFHLRRDETALLCLLLLRGPQTPGELRARAERIFAFEDMAGVTAALQRMSSAGDENSQRVEPLVRLLPRQSGAREARYAQLLTVATAKDSAAATDDAMEQDAGEPLAAESTRARLEKLESAVAVLTGHVRQLQEQLRLQSQAE